MKILVTGGAGFVGTLLSERLWSDGHEVTVYDTFEYGSGPVFHLLKKGIRCINGDVSDFEQLTNAMRGQEFVFHLAGMVGFPLCQRENEKAQRVNVGGTKNVAQAMTNLGIRGCVNASSGSVYGKIDDVCDEGSIPNPQSVYGKTKLAAERILEEQAVHLRFATLCGASPCMRFDLLPNNFTWNAKKYGFLVLYRPNDRRTFLSVDDAVDSYLLAMRNFDKLKGVRINVGDTKLNLTKMELAEAISDLTGCHLHIQEGGIDPDFRDYEVDYTKARSRLGFTASKGLREMLQEVSEVVDITSGDGKWRYSG